MQLPCFLFHLKQINTTVLEQLVDSRDRVKMKVLIRSIEWFILLFIIFVLKCGQSVNSDIEHLNNSSRQQRDYDHGDYHVKCKHSNTGKFVAV